MKKSILIAVVVYCGICVVVFEACCKKKCNDVTNPDCENYDACWDKKINADFTISEYHVSSFDNFKEVWTSESDTVLAVNLTEFKLKTKNYDSVKFYLGSEIIKSKSFVRKYFPYNESISVTCVVYFSSFNDCNLLDNGIDSVTKEFYTIDFNKPGVPIAGEWEGYNTDAPNTIFRVTIFDTVDENFSPPLPWFETKYPYLTNIPNGNDSSVLFFKMANIELGAKSTFFHNMLEKSNINYCKYNQYFGGFIKAFCNNGVITINYQYDQTSFNNYKNGTNNNSLNLINKTFIGKKIRSL
jgi:hypothetical protein